MKKSKIEKILGLLVFLSLFIPIIAFKSHHDCKYDECLRIFYKGDVGICLEGAIDSIAIASCIVWWFLVFGSAIILSKNRNGFYPFSAMVIVVFISVFIAFIDPAKWYFAISLLVSFALFTTAAIIEKKD